jgi:hypothetical protein
MRCALAVAWLLWVFFFSFSAHAEVLQAPVGGKPFSIGAERVACGAPGGGFTLESDHAVKPPVADDAVGVAIEMKVAANPAACVDTKSTITLIATGRFPSVDPFGTVVAVDDARIELRGRRLRGVRVTSRAGTKVAEDTCLDPKPEGNSERCTLAAPRGLPADPTAITLSWLPAGARGASDVTTFDADGRVAAPSYFALPPARITIASLVPSGATVDFASGNRRVGLTHPEAVTSSDCSPATCDVEEGGLSVRRLASVSGSLLVKFRLLPHVALARGDALDANPTVSVPILQCPLTVISGSPLRAVDDARLVVKLSGACARDARSLRFRVRETSAEVLRVSVDGDAAYAVLRIGRIEDEEIAITALRPEPDVSIVGATRMATRTSQPPRARLELPGHGAIDFIPTNRDVRVRLSSGGDHLKLVLLPVSGVYESSTESGVTVLHPVPSAEGFVSLRFAYLAEELPAVLGDVALGFVVEPVQRPIHAANLPAPFGASSLGDHPLVELSCDVGGGKSVIVRPGSPIHVPYGAREGCRLVFHRERLSLDDGTQKLTLDISVTRAGGEPRPDARITEPILLRPGSEPRIVWIRGVAAPFDRVTIRLSHSNDETHYVLGDEIVGAAPSVQWAVIMGTSHARLYATTAIPTGLYRVSDRDHSGILTLNFGVLGRLTWLDADGIEGPLGLELGVMGVGLANDTSSTGRSLTQVATVLGAGLSVPIANRASPTETSINLHAWGEFEPSRQLGAGGGSPFGFVFGPSITIGNIGTNL